MNVLFLVLLRSVISMTRPRVWGMLLAPAFFSLLMGLGLLIWGREPLAAWLMTCQPMPILVSWGMLWLVRILVFIASWMLIFTAVYCSAVLLSSVLVMPWLVAHVAERDYPDVTAEGADSFAAAAANSVIASMLFVLAWVVSLPLWFLPGLALILPLFLMAWYNRRTFAYDALSLHATAAEWRCLKAQESRSFFWLGLIMAGFVYVPFLGLLAPALTALAYIHHGFLSLQRLRACAASDVGGRVFEGECERE